MKMNIKDFVKLAVKKRVRDKKNDQLQQLAKKYAPKMWKAAKFLIDNNGNYSLDIGCYNIRKQGNDEQYNICRNYDSFYIRRGKICGFCTFVESDYKDFLKLARTIKNILEV